MKINVCLATDENYLNYMATTIVSILSNAGKEDTFSFYILCNDISDKSKDYIRALKKFKDFDINFIDMNISDFESFPAGGPHISNTTYYRYKIADICKDIDKIIYLDCDIIVKTSLKELFEEDLSEYYLGGVEDIGYYYWKNYNPDFIYKEGFYINAGMLLINLNAWRDNNIGEKLMDFTTKHHDELAIGDQDVINQVCFGKIKPLSYKWNVQDSFYREKPEREFNPNCNEIIKAAENPAVIHYTNKSKPWNNTNMPKALDWLYFDCTRTGGWDKYIKEYFYHVIVQNIFSIKNVGDSKVISVLWFKIKLKRKRK